MPIRRPVLEVLVKSGCSSEPERNRAEAKCSDGRLNIVPLHVWFRWFIMLSPSHIDWQCLLSLPCSEVSSFRFMPLMDPACLSLAAI
jgi:hypothetical protein